MDTFIVPKEKPTPLDAACFADFKRACLDNGFKGRGKAFFRVHGDGVLQVLKYEYERSGPCYELRVGLFSMYGELREQWFTSFGCIPRYAVVNLIGARDVLPRVEIKREGDHIWYTRQEITPRQQLSVLAEKGFPWLNEITTQAQLAEAICQLDTMDMGKVIRNDDLKYAAYLCAGDLDSAARVVEAILAQHFSAWESNRKTMRADVFQDFSRRLKEEDAHLEELLGMARANDRQAIRKYLDANYQTNSVYARFCMKGK